MKTEELILGADIGGTKSAVVVGTTEGKILARAEWATLSTPGPSALINKIVTHAEEFCKTFGKCKGLGVSIGGPMDMRSGTIIAPPHLPGWIDVPLKKILTERCASSLEEGSSSPIVIQHDAAACLLAEVYWGAAKGSRHAIYLTCGTGLGAGVLIDGKILMGPHGESPEIGFAKLSDDSPTMHFAGVEQRGHAEIYGSGTGIGKLATYRFPSTFPPGTTTKTLSELAQSGHREAFAVLSESAAKMGQLCVTLATLFSPEYILIGSLARYLQVSWLDGIKEYFERESLKINSSATEIMAASLGDKLQDLSSIAPVVNAVVT